MIWRNILFLLIGIYLIYKGHPGWGIFSCLLGSNFYLKVETKGEDEDV